MSRKGFVQVYTGEGKGKTTAALGLAFRAAGAGLRVLFAQFIKRQRCGEHAALERFSDLIRFEQFGAGFIRGRPTEEDRKVAGEGMGTVKAAIASGEYDVVILDEINMAVHYGLVAVEELLALIEAKPVPVELVLTGRYAHPRIIERADLVTEMREIRHYFAKGVEARKGIEC